MSWHKITLPSKESARARALNDAFQALFMANHAPKAAAMFSNRETDFENKNDYYYFSPDAAIFAASLIEGYGGVPCPPPKKDEVSLRAGHDDARNALFP